MIHQVVYYGGGHRPPKACNKPVVHAGPVNTCTVLFMQTAKKNTNDLWNGGHFLPTTAYPQPDVSWTRYILNPRFELQMHNYAYAATVRLHEEYHPEPGISWILPSEKRLDKSGTWHPQMLSAAPMTWS